MQHIRSPCTSEFDFFCELNTFQDLLINYELWALAMILVPSQPPQNVSAEATSSTVSKISIDCIIDIYEFS